MKTKKAIFRKGVLIIAALTLAASATGLLLIPKEADKSEDIIWREYKVSIGSITASLDGGGRLEMAGVDHSFGADTQLEELLVKLGDEVAVGDVLARCSRKELEKKETEQLQAVGAAKRALEDAKNNKLKTTLQRELDKDNTSYDRKSDYDRKRREARAMIDSLESKISSLRSRIDTLEKELLNPDANIDDLNAQLQQAREELKTTQYELDRQENALDDLTSDYRDKKIQSKGDRLIQEQIDVLTLAGLDNAIKNAEAELNKASAGLAEIKQQLTTGELLAKAGGVVTKLHCQQGEAVTGGKAVITIGDGGNKQMVSQIPQEDIGGIELGQLVEMQFLASPDAAVTGKVVKKSLAPADSSDKVTYRVEIAFDNPPADLLQGMTCGVKFIQKRVAGVLTLSNKAITLRDGKQMVTLLLPDGTRQEREIKTGFSDGRTSEIKAGLGDGDIVVVAG